MSKLFGDQPYSMGPVTRWDPEAMRIMPASGSLVMLDGDAPLRSIAACLVAPTHVQRKAQASGERAIIMIRPKGLREALERSKLARGQL